MLRLKGEIIPQIKKIVEKIGCLYSKNEKDKKLSPILFMVLITETKHHISFKNSMAA
jgi:hypothetical protein